MNQILSKGKFLYGAIILHVELSEQMTRCEGGTKKKENLELPSGGWAPCSTAFPH